MNESDSHARITALEGEVGRLQALVDHLSREATRSYHATTGTAQEESPSAVASRRFRQAVESVYCAPDDEVVREDQVTR